MNLYFKLVILLLGFFSFSTVQATPANFAKPSILLQFNKDSFTIDEANIESVASVPVDEVRNEYALQVKLNKDAAIELNKLSSQHTGERLTISLNDRIVSSPMIGSALGGQFLMTGFTREEAKKFVESLNVE